MKDNETSINGSLLKSFFNDFKEETTINFLVKVLLITIVAAFIYALMRALANHTARFEIFTHKADDITNVIQVTLGVGVTFAGALVAIKLARVAHILSTDSLTVSKTNARRAQLNEFSDLLDKTQKKFSSLATAIQAMIRETALDDRLVRQLDWYALNQLIEQPFADFSFYQSKLDDSFNLIEEQECLTLIAKLGAKATYKHQPIPDEPPEIVEDTEVTMRANCLSRNLLRYEEVVNNARIDCREKLAKIIKTYVNTADAIDAVTSDFYCRSIILSQDGDRGLDTIEKADLLSENLRSIAGTLGRKGDALHVIGSAYFQSIVTFKDVETKKGFNTFKKTVPMARELATWCFLNSDCKAADFAYRSQTPSIGEYRCEAPRWLTNLMHPIENLFPKEINYKNNISSISSEIALNTDTAPLDGIPAFMVPAMKYLGYESQMGSILSKAKKFMELSGFEFCNLPSETDANHPDVPFQNALLKTVTRMWLGNQYNTYFEAIKTKVPM